MLGVFMSDKWSMRVGLGVLFLSIMLFAYTMNYLVLVLPLGFLFMMLLGANWRMAYWVMLFTIPASIDVQFMGGSLSSSLPDEPLMWIFLLIFPFIWARNPDMFPVKAWWRNPIVFITVLQFLWLIVAVIYSRELLFSVKFLLAKCWFLVSFFILPFFIFSRKKDFKVGFLVTLVPLVGTMVIILIKHAALGFHFRKVEQAIGSIYYNHVDYSAVMSMIFPLLLIAFPLTKGKGPIVRAALIATIIFFIPALYLTYARAAVLAVVFGVMVGVAIRMRLANLIFPVFYGLIALLVVYMASNNRYIDYRPNYEKTYMHKNFAEHVIATFRGEDMSSMERLYRWIAAMRMSKDEPVTGFGPNAFYYYYKPYTVTAFKTYVSRNKDRSTTHNYFLYMLTEQGWPAMILYAILVMVVVAQAQKIYHRFKDKFYKNVTLGVAMMFGAGFINNFFSELLETHKVGSLWYLSLSLLVVLAYKSKQEKEYLEKYGEATVQ